MDFAFHCVKKVLKDRRKALASKGQNGHSCVERGLWESSHRNKGQEGEATKLQVNKKRENGK